MSMELYSGSIEGLIQWCQSAEILARYTHELQLESEHIADTTLLNYLKSMSAVCDGIAREGYASALAADAALLDSLLTDVFSVASYGAWDHPMHCEQRSYSVGQESLPAAGLLGYDQSKQGAQIYVIDRTHLVLSRQREAGQSAS